MRFLLQVYSRLTVIYFELVTRTIRLMLDYRQIEEGALLPRAGFLGSEQAMIAGLAR